MGRFFRRLKKAKPIMQILQLNPNGNELKNREAIYNHIMNKDNSSDDEEDNQRK